MCGLNREKSPYDEENLCALEKELGIKISNRELLKTAISSVKAKEKYPDIILECNQRLSFLGDSVLYFIASEYVNKKELDVECLHNLREKYRKNDNLEKVLTELGLDHFFWFEERYTKNPPSNKWIILMATFLEAIIGATYLDKHDIISSKNFVDNFLIPNIDKIIHEGED